jgi:hypothetical protein
MRHLLDEETRIDARVVLRRAPDLDRAELRVLDRVPVDDPLAEEQIAIERELVAPRSEPLLGPLAEHVER